MGRIDFENPKLPSFSFPGVSISLRFKKSAFCDLHLESNKKDYYTIIVDEGEPFTLEVDNYTTRYSIAKDLDTSKEHTVQIIKRTEEIVGKGIFRGIGLSGKAELLPWVNKTDFQIEFIGNSITCGYGNEGENQHCNFSGATENNYLAYSALTARALNAEYMITAASGYGLMRSYQLDTLKIMPRFYDRVHVLDTEERKEYKNLHWDPLFTIINLGTNDFSKSIPDSVAFVDKYLSFIDEIKEKHPKTKVVCLSGPMLNNNWPPKTYALLHLNNYLKVIVKEANTKGQEVYFFELTPQGKVGYGCDWHPNLAQHELNAKDLSQFLSPLINQ
ncbi:MAG: SGNH/GDSL hydrolase family protein [Cytophagales bacterium]|nr:SGNH/GDSL hydrolase family protein [Cytophagales bacterium]